MQKGRLAAVCSQLAADIAACLGEKGGENVEENRLNKSFLRRADNAGAFAGARARNCREESVWQKRQNYGKQSPKTAIEENSPTIAKCLLFGKRNCPTPPRTRCDRMRQTRSRSDCDMTHNKRSLCARFAGYLLEARCNTAIASERYRIE